MSAAAAAAAAPLQAGEGSDTAGLQAQEPRLAADTAPAAAAAAAPLQAGEGSDAAGLQAQEPRLAADTAPAAATTAAPLQAGEGSDAAGLQAQEPRLAAAAASQVYIRTLAIDADVKLGRFDRCATATRDLLPRLSSFYGDADQMVTSLKEKMGGLSLAAFKALMDSAAEAAQVPSPGDNDDNCPSDEQLGCTSNLHCARTEGKEVGKVRMVTLVLNRPPNHMIC
jgi:hypothetical protein